ncbi:MAG: hypothetical protein CXZ00_08200 [Acidobacteria bacterium]|nr:MAG: hypothetical protein CXZ00_08200 [Acidobacteriota bacterium]
MHSAEPTESRFVKNQTNHTGQSWRAEVASRVNSYRGRKHEEKDSPAPDASRAAERKNLGTPSPGASNLEKPAAEPCGLYVRRNLFDTNYYRRLNAESMALRPAVNLGATVAIEEHVPELEVESDVESIGKTRSEAFDDVDFDLEIQPAVAEDSFLERCRIAEPEPEPKAESLSLAVETTPPPAVLPQGNVIVFPRPALEPPLVPLPSRDELAEPMHNRPRILEVPEDIMPAFQVPLFPQIRLDIDDEDEETGDFHVPAIEVPLRVALISERVVASLTDLAVVAAAGLIFAGMACYALPDIPHAKPFWMGLGAATLLFWTVYQHLFLLYAGKTPGMSMRGIRLSTFDGRVPQWDERRRRARYVFISFVSIALGFLWAMVDEDTLCWHDRVSQTFPTTE